MMWQTTRSRQSGRQTHNACTQYHLARNPRRSGVAMILVLIAVSIATILSLSFLASQATTHGVSQNIQNQAQARSVAESALVAAINYVQNNSDFRDVKTNGLWASDVSFNGGTFDLYGYDGVDTDDDGVVDDTDGDLADDNTDPLTLTVVGHYNGVSHTVHAVVTVGAGVPDKDILMIVDNDSSLSTLETQRKELIESWGWAVTVLSDSATSSEYDTVLEEVDAVLVSDSANAGSVNTKLREATIGVVIEQRGILDDMKLSTGSSTYNGISIDIVDANHYITNPFGNGTLTLTASNVALGTPSGGLATGLTTLAERPSSSTPVVVVMESGAPLYSSGIAAGRRVWIPTGSIPVSDMTADAKTLFERAMLWASGGDADQFISGHWTFDDGVGQVAYDSSGNAQHGPITAGSPSTTWTAGMVYGALQFDGTGDGFVRIPDSDVLDLSEEGTLTAWVYLTGYQNFMGIIHKGEDKDWDDEAYSLQFWTSRKLALTFTTASGQKRIVGKGSLSNGQWYHVAGTWGPNGMYLYINGEEDNSNSITAVGVPSTGSVQIGSQLSEYYNSSYRNFPFRGLIDDARIYRRTLTAGEIKAIYDEATANHDAPQLIALYEFQKNIPEPPTMLAHWPLDDTVSGGGAGFAVAIGDQLSMYVDTVIDSYASSNGAYGGANVGSDAYASTNTTSSNRVELTGNAKIAGDFDVGPGGNPSTVIQSSSSIGITGATGTLTSTVSYPSISVPSGLPSSSGNQTYNGGSHTISSDTVFQNLTFYNYATLTINGDVTIQVIGNLNVSSGYIVLAPGATLRMYVGGNVTVYNNSYVNNDSTRTSDFTLYMYGSNKKLSMTSNNVMSGLIYVSGDAELYTNATVYGAIFVNDDLTMSADAAIHIDTNLAGKSLVATDEVNGNDGSDSGGVTSGVSGCGDGGTAFEFDGSDDYIAIAHDNKYLLDNGSVSLWFKSDNLSGHKAIFSKDSKNYDTGGHLHIYTDGSTLKARLQSTSSEVTLTSSGLSTGNWYHVVVCWGVSGFKLFKNGVEVDSDSYVGGLSSTSGGIGNYEPIAIGAGTWTSDDKLITPITYPFDGVIDDVRIYDQALNEDQAAELYNGEEPTGGLPATVYDTSAVGIPVDLTIQDPENVTWVSGGGLTIDSPTVLSSSGATNKIYNELTTTDQMAMEIVFTPANVSQTGPARIVSLSGSASSRNFTFGQEGSTYDFRLRTSTSTSNGLPAIVSSPVLAADAREHIVISYDGEKVDIYRNGTLEISEERTGTFNWDSTFQLLMCDEAGGGREWLGTLHRVSIYNKAFNAVQAGNVFIGDPPGNGIAPSIGATNWVEQ